MHRPPFREKISREGYTFTSIPPTRDDRRPSSLPSTVYKGEKNQQQTVDFHRHYYTLFV